MVWAGDPCMQVSRCVGDFVSETESSYYRNLHARLHRVHLLDTVGTLFSNIRGFFGKMAHIQQRLSEISKMFVPYRGHLFCGHPFVGWMGFLFSVSIAVTVYVFPRASAHVIDIPRLMAREDRDEAAQRHDAKVEADGANTPVGRQPRRDRWDERRADGRDGPRTRTTV